MAEMDLDTSGEKINVLVRSREKTYYEGEAEVISSNNETGVFDVLPKHANFITLIKDYITIVGADKKEQKLEIDTGVMRVASGQVEIYLTV